MLEALLDDFKLLIKGLFFVPEHFNVLMSFFILSERLLQLENLLRLLSGPMIHIIDSLRRDLQLLVLGLQFGDGDSDAQLLE